MLVEEERVPVGPAGFEKLPRSASMSSSSAILAALELLGEAAGAGAGLGGAAGVVWLAGAGLGAFACEGLATGGASDGRGGMVSRVPAWGAGCAAAFGAAGAGAAA